MAIVTSGSRGIGFTVVRTFLESGAKVAPPPGGGGLRTRRWRRSGRSTWTGGHGPHAGAAGPEIRGGVLQSGPPRAEEIDILVNNAGITSSTKLGNYSDEELRRVLDLNVFSVLNCSRAVVESMKARGGGVILNTSSMVSICGQPTCAAYPASKFAVNGATLSLVSDMNGYITGVVLSVDGMCRSCIWTV